MQEDIKKNALYLLIAGIILVSVIGGVAYLIYSQGQSFKSETSNFHKAAVSEMHKAVVRAGLRCQVIADISPDLVAEFNPFAGKAHTKSIPQVVYKDNAEDFMGALNKGYLSLKKTQSTALMAIEGNLFPLNGICSKRLSRVDYGLFFYATSENPTLRTQHKAVLSW